MAAKNEDLPASGTASLLVHNNMGTQTEVFCMTWSGAFETGNAAHSQLQPEDVEGCTHLNFELHEVDSYYQYSFNNLSGCRV